MDEVNTLVGAQVNYLRFSYQIDINVIRGSNRDRKYANLQIEVPFQLKTKNGSLTIDPNDLTTLPQLIPLLHTTLVDINLTESHELTLSFDNDMQIEIKQAKKYEAWNLTGDGLPHVIAS